MIFYVDGEKIETRQLNYKEATKIFDSGYPIVNADAENLRLLICEGEETDRGVIYSGVLRYDSNTQLIVASTPEAVTRKLRAVYQHCVDEEIICVSDEHKILFNSVEYQTQWAQTHAVHLLPFMGISDREEKDNIIVSFYVSPNRVYRVFIAHGEQWKTPTPIYALSFTGLIDQLADESKMLRLVPYYGSLKQEINRVIDFLVQEIQINSLGMSVSNMADVYQHFYHTPENYCYIGLRGDPHDYIYLREDHNEPKILSMRSY